MNMMISRGAVRRYRAIRTLAIYLGGRGCKAGKGTRVVYVPGNLDAFVGGDMPLRAGGIDTFGAAIHETAGVRSGRNRRGKRSVGVRNACNAAVAVILSARQ